MIFSAGARSTTQELQRRLDLFCLARLGPRDRRREGEPEREEAGSFFPLARNEDFMLAEQFLTATAGARNSTALDEIARLTWRAHGEGYLADAIQTGRRWRTDPRSREFGMAAENLFVS